MDLNKVQIIGRTTQEVELKQTPNWQSVATISVATNRNWTDWNWVKQDLSEFHNVVLWGKLAELASQYLQKWRKVYIEWRLQTRSWEAQDGTKRYKTEIVGKNMILLDSNWWNQNQDEKPKKENDDFISIEDIPF